MSGATQEGDLGHTPGPWEVEGAEFYRDEERRGLVGYYVRLPGGPRISKANADLIAAAPDLLAALEGLMEMQEVRQKLLYLDSGIGTNTMGGKILLAARAAIAKARALPSVLATLAPAVQSPEDGGTR